MNTRRIMALKEAIHRSGAEHMDDNMTSADGVIETATAVIIRLTHPVVNAGYKAAMEQNRKDCETV